MDSDAKRVRGRKRASTFMPFFVCLFYFSNAYSTHLVFYHLRSWNSHLMTPQVGTPGNCCWRGGGVVPHGSPNSDPISEQKCHFPHPFSDPEVVAKRNITSLHKTEIMSSLQQKYFLKSISNSHITLSFRVAKIYFVFTQTACLVFALKPCDISHTVSLALTL